jgi:tetratricopeptide (TPR) repeat protein
MKTIIGVIIIAGLLVGCAGGELVKSDPKKYFQMKNPRNSEEMIQWTLPTESGCLFILSTMKEAPLSQQMADSMSCSNISISSYLPFNIKARESSMGTILDIDFFSLKSCKKLEESHEGIEILVPCHHKDITQWLAIVEQSIKEQPQNATSWTEKGEILVRLKRYEEALPALDTAISLNSNLALVWAIKSWALYELRRYNDALIAIDKAIQLRPNTSQYLKGRKIITDAMEGRLATKEEIEALTRE